jgi:hypothetical protein
MFFCPLTFGREHCGNIEYSVCGFDTASDTRGVIHEDASWICFDLFR